jgi:hypothetical protein
MRNVIMFILLPEDEPVSPMLMNWKSNARD